MFLTCELSGTIHSSSALVLHLMQLRCAALIYMNSILTSTVCSLATLVLHEKRLKIVDILHMNFDLGSRRTVKLPFLFHKS